MVSDLCNIRVVLNYNITAQGYKYLYHLLFTLLLFADLTMIRHFDLRREQLNYHWRWYGVYMVLI